MVVEPFCLVEVYRRFSGVYCLHHIRDISRKMKQVASNVIIYF